MRWFPVVAAGLLATACHTSPTAPSLPPQTNGPNSGTWVGTLRDDANGPGDLRVVLQETVVSGTSLLTGTWTSTYADGAKNAAGDASGGLTGTRAFLTLRRTVPLSCADPGLLPQLNGAVVSLDLSLDGRTLSGAYTYQACNRSIPGTLTLTRQ
jgi:hypothetical protein